ncbi:hypothetical protein [Chitinophaga eiseniae]|nr:hypothetical protein [Chitinophaga eiseniae]
MPDPAGILLGTGKLSRYREIHDESVLQSGALQKMVEADLMAYRKRM